jgi:hypothetical protein
MLQAKLGISRKQVTMAFRLTLRLLVASLVLALQACVVVPRTSASYNPDCQLTAKHMDLQTVQLGTMGSCKGNECAAALVAFGAVAAASFVVSGSIVVAGNVVYWVEERGHCNPPPG